MQQRYSDAIAKEFLECITSTIRRLGNVESHRPFHTSLLSNDALFWSRFERSFSTSFGQRVIEKISRLAALSGGATDAGNQRPTIVNLTIGQLSAIDHHIALMRNGQLGRKANWLADLASVRDIPIVGPTSPHRVISDLWWVKDGIDHFMSIKTVKPNIDQTAEAKRDLLKLALHSPEARVYYGLYYNPYGMARSAYNHTPPMGIFDFHRDPVILIGKDYWETLGGVGFYEELLAICEEVGQETRGLLNNLTA